MDLDLGLPGQPPGPCPGPGEIPRICTCRDPLASWPLPHVASGLSQSHAGLGMGLYLFTPGPTSQSRGALIKSLAQVTETRPPQLSNGDIAPTHGQELGLSEATTCLGHSRHTILVGSHPLFPNASSCNHFVF